MGLEVKVEGANKLRAMADALRRADRLDLHRQLGQAIKDAAKPTAEAVQDSARHITTRGIPKPGARRRFVAVVRPKDTRAKIADAVQAEVNTALENPKVSFTVRSSRLPEVIRAMPRKFDSEGTFRHPVMGNTNAWVAQTGDPWFWKPIKDHIKTFRAEIDKALDTVREELERG